jgi:hypothetical protein
MCLHVNKAYILISFSELPETLHNLPRDSASYFIIFINLLFYYTSEERMQEATKPNLHNGQGSDYLEDT